MQSTLRIVSVCRTLPTPDRPGAGVFVLRRLAGMASAADVRVLQPIPFLPGIRPLPAWADSPHHEVEGTRILHQPMLYIPGILKSLDARWLARSVLPRLTAWRAEWKPHLVDAHFGYPDGVGCVLAAQRLGLPAFVTIRGLEVDRIRRRFIRHQLVAALNCATGCISVSHSLRSHMIECGVAADRIVVIPNAVDREVFHPGDRLTARGALGIPSDGHLVVSVGSLVSVKRHDVLIRAVARLRQRKSPLMLAIVGGQDYESDCPRRLRVLARSLDNSLSVRFVGAVPPRQVAEWLRAADVFALATAREGCCNAILEAIASGTPVVTTPVGDNPYYVLDGENGYLVPGADPEAMAAAIGRALDREWDREQIAKRLAVGNWSATGRALIQYLAERLVATNRMAA